MRKKIEMLDRVFGRLTVIEEVGFIRKHLRWKCKCECGNVIITSGNALRSGKAKSCGCYMIDRIKETNSTQGGNSVKNKVEYRTWRAMISRCYNKKNPKYKDYGGRGIIICDRWIGEDGFKNFLSDMGKKPSPELSLDRFPDNANGNYEPSNCRWATISQQQHNLRSNRWFEYNGKKMVLHDWCKELGIQHKAFIRLFNKIKN